MEDGREGGAGGVQDPDGVREFFRVRAEIPLRVEPLEPADYGRVASQILSQIDPEIPKLDPALVGWLDRIERKLDRILAHLERPESRSSSDWGRTTGLSGSGLSFVPDHPIEPGSALVVEFELPETPIRTVRCIGRVVDQPEDPAAAGAEWEPSEIGVAFETIRLADRDAVVRTTLAIERQQIRLDDHGNAGS